MKINRIEGLCYTQLHIIHIVLGVNTVNTRVRLVRRHWLKRAVPTSVQMVAINTTWGGGVDVSIQLRLLFHP